MKRKINLLPLGVGLCAGFSAMAQTSAHSPENMGGAGAGHMSTSNDVSLDMTHFFHDEHAVNNTN